MNPVVPARALQEGRRSDADRFQGVEAMIRRLVLLTVFALFAGPAAAQVNALPPTRHILVYGDAEARAIPDRFKVTLRFTALDMDAGAARERVESNIARSLERLRAAGVDGNEIVATSMSVEPKERYDDERDEEVFLGTEVRRSLTARFDSKRSLEAFIAGVRTSRELTISSVQTELSDEPALRAALRGKAIESSRRKAEEIAKAYGARLGGLYSVSDVAPQFQYGIREGSWPSVYRWRGDSESLDRIEVTGSRVAPAASPVALQTGYITFSDKIYAVFLLAD